MQGQQGQAHWVAKQPGRFCGGTLVQRLFQRLDPGVNLRLLRQDGDAVEVGDCLLELQGPATALVAGERTAYFSSRRSPGVVLRVSARRTPVPSSWATKAAVAVAIPERRMAKFKAVRSPATKAAAGPCSSSRQSPASTASPVSYTHLRAHET